MRINRAAALTAAVIVALTLAPVTADAATKKPPIYRSCALLWRAYPHGVAQKQGARDKVKGRTRPVTTFKVDKRVYDANRARLDKDRDLIACERA